MGGAWAQKKMVRWREADAGWSRAATRVRHVARRNDVQEGPHAPPGGHGAGAVHHGSEGPGAMLVRKTQQRIKDVLSRNDRNDASGLISEADLLTEEQMLASMLPLDQVLELDQLDIDAVARFLH